MASTLGTALSMARSRASTSSTRALRLSPSCPVGSIARPSSPQAPDRGCPADHHKPLSGECDVDPPAAWPYHRDLPDTKEVRVGTGAKIANGCVGGALGQAWPRGGGVGG